ncbi:hypothetical protein ASPZODRAFT_130497 [Penicilliopsis zonata CBS 506.65]|uniref:Rhodopsin domain-containing protein n=1 Tax=Penicilliopsis zonata CBS 506.65 TaxID=1073090 RepID=A0A1L9SN37_9EURO|nr:hypothetical protein ASPZODRAFT_130497 [Penicilliopsis zonata CBS 506.65]OJJ48464.1 hypothetical protein ASPZODRAFT_130497 [Penicilliopsis zonata CBS 506.65]
MFELQPLLLSRGQAQEWTSNGGARGLAISIVFTILATIFVCARLYTRVSIMKRMEANDCMILFALANSFIFMGFFIVEAISGMGMHEAEIPPHILTRQMKAFWITIPFYNAALVSAKASILMQYFRVFPTKRMRVICWIMLTFVALFGLWAVLSAFLNCIPVAKFWNPTIPGYCLDKEALWFSNAGLHITTDLIILAIPIPALLSLDLPRRQKMALFGIFALGGFVCITSVIRLLALKKISGSTDPTYDNVGAAIWSAIECNTGIICACLPTLRPLISHFLPHILSTFSNGSRSEGTVPLSQERAPTYWNGMATISSTIGAPCDEVEYDDDEADVAGGIPLGPTGGSKMASFKESLRGSRRRGRESKATASSSSASSSLPPSPSKQDCDQV